jgi:uncharacterized membrane protein
MRPQLEPGASRAAACAVWCAVALLVVVGAAAAVGRSLHPADFTSRVERSRPRLLQALGRADPHAGGRGVEIQRVDARFAAHPWVTLLHTVPGGVLLVLFPLQFSPRLRGRQPRLHRWSGRVLLAIGSIVAATGLYFGLLMPYGGWAEAAAVALFGALFLVAAGKALVAIRAGEPAIHREWMIRASAVAIGIASVRVAGAVLDVALTPEGYGLQTMFVLSLWTGWTLTVGAAELWIRYTRRNSSL